MIAIEPKHDPVKISYPVTKRLLGDIALHNGYIKTIQDAGEFSKKADFIMGCQSEESLEKIEECLSLYTTGELQTMVKGTYEEIDKVCDMHPMQDGASLIWTIILTFLFNPEGSLDRPEEGGV